MPTWIRGNSAGTRQPSAGKVSSDTLKGRRAFASLVPAALYRRQLLRRISQKQGLEAGLRLTVAAGYEASVAALRLAHDHYVRRGIEQPTACGFRSNPFHLSPGTTMFTAHLDGALVGTISLIEDSPIGLPMDLVHPDEVTRRRQLHRRLAEAGTLTVSPDVRGAVVSFLLYNMMFRWARFHRGVDDLLIAVHPRAQDVYTKGLLFDRLGPVRQYASLSNASSVPLMLDLPTAAERFQRVYARPGMQFSMRGVRTDLYRFFFADANDEIELPARGAFPFSLSPTMPWSREDIARYLAECQAGPEALRGFAPDAQARASASGEPRRSAA